MNQREWKAGIGIVDLNARTVKIQSDEVEVTFTSINISQSAVELLGRLTVSWCVSSLVSICIASSRSGATPVQHLYPDGRIPILSNSHTRADVTGYAVLKDRPYQHTLVYVGIAAHKTSVESLWASLIRGKAAARCMAPPCLLMGGEDDDPPLPEFNVLHAGIVCRKALPGKWEAKDDVAYALIFESEAAEEKLKS